MAEHFLDDTVIQPFWDNSIEPRLEIDSGDTVVFDCLEANGQIQPDWTVADYENADRSKIHALNGSVWVKGAQPGDVLEIDILDMRHKGWGWSAHRPGMGLLPDDFDFILPASLAHRRRYLLFDPTGSHQPAFRAASGRGRRCATGKRPLQHFSAARQRRQP